MVELDHRFSTGKPIEYNWEAILDLERVIPCVEGGRVIERTGPDSAKAEIKVKMGAMSMTFTGTVTVIEQDEAAHRAVLQVKSREAGGQGHANADVDVRALGRRRHDPHRRADHRQGGLDGRGRGGQRARRADQGLHREAREHLMPGRTMRRVREGEVPFDGGTAVQEDADKPVFRGNGTYDYLCVECGNVLAEAMDPEHMGKRVRDSLRALPHGQRRGRGAGGDEPAGAALMAVSGLHPAVTGLVLAAGGSQRLGRPSSCSRTARRRCSTTCSTRRGRADSISSCA